MNGKIYFMDLKELSDFLSHFTGNTSTFEVKMDGNGRWVLEFLGGF